MLDDPRNRKKINDITKRLRLEQASTAGSNSESERSLKEKMMNELNLVKAQEMVWEPNSDGTSKKNKNMVRKGNDGSKKRNSTDSSGPSGPATKKASLVGIRLQNKESCWIVFL